MSIQQLAEVICICTGNHDPDKRIECAYAVAAANKVVAAGWHPANSDVKHLADLLRAVRSYDNTNGSDLPLTLLTEIDRALPRATADDDGGAA